MPAKGTIHKNGIMHKVAEAILTHPQDEFLCSDIWTILNNDYPDITLGAVSHCITKTNSPISKLCFKTTTKKGTAAYFKKFPNSVMPPISKFKSKPKSKTVKPIPDTVTDIQIGQSFIIYIDNLRDKIKSMATAIGDMQAKYKSEKGVFRMTLKQKENTIDKLQEELNALRKLKKTKSRTFNMSELLK